MAALNTLRTKGGVVLAVVIGISLLAFLLGDLASSGGALFGASKMNVGTINGQSISYQQYQSKVDQLTQVNQIMSGSDVLNEEQNKAVRNQAWQELISSVSFDQSLKDMGLLVSDQEAIDMTTGKFISPVISGMFVNPQTGNFDTRMLQQYVSNLDNDETGRSRYLWSFVESQMIQNRAITKYNVLVGKSVFTNNLEIEDAVKGTDETYDITFVQKEIASVPDSTVNVTNADLKNYYNTHKRSFKQVASRDIEYVVFDATPSDKDYEDAANYIGTLYSEFQTTEDIQKFVELNSKEQFNGAYLSKAQMPDSLGKFAFSASKGATFGPVLEDDVYTLARLIDVKELPDTIGVRMIALQSGDKLLADSLVNVLKAKPEDFAAFADEYSLNTRAKGGDLGRFNPYMMFPTDIADRLASAPVNEVFSMNTPYGVSIFKVDYRGNVSPKAKVGTIVYNVEPGDATIQSSFAAAAKFASDVTQKGSDFDKTVNEGKYSKHIARLRAGDTNESGVNGMRDVVRWAFGAETGDVSNVISIENTNIIARVVDSGEHGVAPFEKVVNDIRPAVIYQKIVEKISSEFASAKATSLEDLAAKFKLNVDSTQASFVSPYVTGMGLAPKVVGAVTVLKKGEISKPIATGSAVAVVKVVGEASSTQTIPEQQKALINANTEAIFSRAGMDAVFQLADVQDMRIKLY